MVIIELEGGKLDVYAQDIEWSWSTIRFSESIRDQYTNDFEIPKTENNMRLLGVAGLLDSRTQPLGEQIVPCTMTVGSKIMNVYLQVVSVRKEDITICVYEKLFPNNVRDSKINKYVVDDDSSIYAWNTNSDGTYPEFRKYWYGMAYNKSYAQLHPSKLLSEVIQKVNAGMGIEMPDAPSSKYVVATKKTVCPQNRIQVIEGHWTADSGNFAVLYGGQHITNDCEFSYSPTSTEITFNRDCKVKGRFFYAYKKKSTVTNDFSILVCRYDTGQPVYAPGYTIPSHLWASLVLEDSYTAVMHEGSVLRVQCNDTNKYDMLNFVLYLEISDYAVTDDDYGIELQYVGRAPRINVWSDDGQFKFGAHGWQQLASSNGGYTYCYLDGTTYSAHVHKTGHPSQTETQDFTLRWSSLAYFGYWCNLADMTVKDLMFGACWIDGKKLTSTSYYDGWQLHNVVEYVDATDTDVIDGWITETRPASDKLGKSNYIMFGGRNHEDTEPVVSIENQWLENEKDIHTSPFYLSVQRYGNLYCLEQYSEPEHDADSGEYKCKFSDTGFAIADKGTPDTLLYKLVPSTMGFEQMTQSVEADIDIYDNDIRDLDYVFLEGHKYMVVEGNIDLEGGYGNIKALLVPYNEDDINWSGGGSPEIPEEQYPDDHEPSYPDDPTDDFDPGDHYHDPEDDQDEPDDDDQRI